MNLKQREAELLATTEADREEGNEENPFVYAESAPNRFRIMSFFFPNDDGVKIQEDLDLNEVSVEYFNDTERVTLTEGALYEWAIDQYENHF
jgi:hypothetical protein